MVEPYPVAAAPGPPGRPPGPPGPPPGPGVQPPFVAAPVEGRRARTWLGLGLAGAILAACCGVGVVAIGGLLAVGQEAVNEQARRAAGDYLAAVADRNWEEAYELRCRQDRQAESLFEFTSRVSAEPRIGSYQVGDMDPEPDGDITVPVQVTYADGTADRLVFPIEQNPNGQLEVCGRIRQE